MPGFPLAPSDARSYVGIGKQANKGTGVAPTLFVPFIPSVDLDHGANINKIMEAGGGGQVTYTEKVSHLPGGKVLFLARPQVTTKMAAYMLGVDNVTGAGPYSHAVTDDFTTDYVTVEQNLSDEGIERFVDCGIGEMVFSSDVGSPIVRVTSTWIGGTPAWQGAPTSESYEADAPFTHGDAVYTLDGGAVTNVQKFTLTVRVKIAVEQTVNVTPEFLVKMGMEVDLELQQLTTDISAEYRKAMYGAVGNSVVQRTATSGSFIADYNYGAGAAARQLKLEIPTLDYYSATYTSLSPDASEATKVVRSTSARKVIGSSNPLFRLTGKTADSLAYVT